MKPAVTQPRRRGARPGFPMRHKLAQLPFEAMEPMGMEVTGVVRHGLAAEAVSIGDVRINRAT